MSRQDAASRKELNHMVNDEGQILSLWIVPHFRSTLRVRRLFHSGCFCVLRG